MLQPPGVWSDHFLQSLQSTPSLSDCVGFLMSNVIQAQLCTLQKKMLIRKLLIVSVPSWLRSATLSIYGVRQGLNFHPQYSITTFIRIRIGPDTHECFQAVPYKFFESIRCLEAKKIFFCDQYRRFRSLAQLLSINTSSMWPRAMTLLNCVIAGTTKGGLKANQFCPHNSPWTATRPFPKTTVLIASHPWNFKMCTPFDPAMECDCWSCDLRWGFLINDLALAF